MKIRKGFVSNSSTSNFIVRIKQDDWFKEKDAAFLVSEEDIPKLEEYGFEKTNLIDPFVNKNEITEIGNPNSDHYVSMKYRIVCNEEEVIKFLVKNNIPFKASVHYNHKYISYQKDSDYIFKATNYGIIFNMYGECHHNFLLEKDIKPYYKIPKEEYL